MTGIFLRATVVTRGWNGYRNKSQHRKSTLEKKILPPFQQGFEPATFQSRVRCSNHWAIPRPPHEAQSAWGTVKNAVCLNYCLPWRGVCLMYNEIQSTWGRMKCSLPEIMQSAQNIRYEMKLFEEPRNTTCWGFSLSHIPRGQIDLKNHRLQSASGTLKCTLRKIHESGIYRRTMKHSLPHVSWNNTLCAPNTKKEYIIAVRRRRRIAGISKSPSGMGSWRLQ